MTATSTGRKQDCQPDRSQSSQQVKVWDPLVRTFHWGLVSAFAVAYLTREQEYESHLIAGYCVLGLVAIRLIWGVVGTRHARFADFINPPSRVAGYLRLLLTGHAPRCYAGHNPAGGVMVVALLATLLVATLSGIALDTAENRAGPLGETRVFLYGDLIKAAHTVASDLAITLIALHLLGVIHASLIHRENLLRAMVTGRKRA